MTWGTGDKLLWDSIKPALSAKKDDKGRIEGLGTAFVCGREGTRTYLLTCWHVVQTISAEHLHIMGHPTEVIWQGDKALDLAILAVNNLPAGEILGLSAGGQPDQSFRTIGHFWANDKDQDIPDSRPLSGRLGQERRKHSDRYGPIVGWEFSIDKDDFFDRIRAGYSGAPIFDPRSGQIVAVISHQEGEKHGHAVDIANLRNHQVVSSMRDKQSNLPTIIEAFFADDKTGDEGSSDVPWIVKTLDHNQAQPLRDRLQGGNCPVVAVIDGFADDLPKYFADDVFLDPWPKLEGQPQEAITLNLTRYGHDNRAFWHATHQNVPSTHQSIDNAGERDAVCAWLRRCDRHVFFVSVDMEVDGWHLPRLLRAAQSFLAELSEFDGGLRILLLIICQPRRDTPPWWWSALRFIHRRRLPGVLWLSPLRALARPDIHAWLDGFSSEAKLSLNRDRLLDDLLELFDSQGSDVRYRSVRRRLLDGGALDNARFGSQAETQG